MNTNRFSCLHVIIAILAFASMARAEVAVSINDSPGGTLNLPSLGITDWVSLGPATHGRNEKLGADQIGAVTAANGAAVSQVTSGSWYSTWTGGTPTNSATEVKGKWEAKDNSGNGGFSFSVSGLEDGAYSMKVYVTKYSATAELTASVGATSNSAAFNTGGTVNSTYHSVYTIAFDISSSETLDIDYLITAHGGSSSSDNLGIAAITLSKDPTVAINVLGTNADAVNPINLTAEGTTDWVKLGETAIRDEKVGGTAIGVVSIVSATANPSAGGKFRSEWTDGTPTSSASDLGEKWQADATSGNGGFSFSVSGLIPGTYTLKVYATKYKATGRLSASMASGSTSVDFTTGGTVNTTYYAVYTIEFDVTSSETLNIDYIFIAHANDTSDNLGIHAITLAKAPLQGTVIMVL